MPIRRPIEIPEKQIGLALPLPITGRLDGLLEIATEAGEKTSRKELTAALIEDAPTEPAALANLVRTYRLAPMRDAIIDGQPPSWYTEPIRQPGPRQLDPRDRDDDMHAREVLAAKRLRHFDRVRVGVSLPRVLDDKLDKLVGILEDLAENTARAEVVAALILAAPSDPPSLARIIAAHRAATSMRRRRQAAARRRIERAADRLREARGTPPGADADA